MVVALTHLFSSNEIVLESDERCCVERNQPALSKLRLADHETVWRDIVHAQGKSFRNTQSRCRKQPEESGVGVRAQRTHRAKTHGVVDYLTDIRR